MLRRGAFTAKQLLVSWLKFLCEALGRSSLRSKLRASSMHWYGIFDAQGVRGDFSESLNRLLQKIIINKEKSGKCKVIAYRYRGKRCGALCL